VSASLLCVKMLLVTMGRGASPGRRPRNNRALRAKLAALIAKAHPKPAVAAITPATGASKT